MKLHRFILLTLFAIVNNVQAHDYLSVEDIKIPQDGSANITITFNFDEPDVYTAYQFDIVLPTGIEFTKDSKGRIKYSPGDCHEESHNISTNYDVQTNTLKITCLSLASDPIYGTSGVLLTIPIQADEFLNSGVQMTGLLQNVTLATLDAQSVECANVSFKVTMSGGTHRITYLVDGEVYKTTMIEVGAELMPEIGPSKEGYMFGGWDGLPKIMPEHDVEVTALFFLYGDVNTDTRVNVVDVVDIARFVVETPSERFREELADLNRDYVVTIADAVVLVNHIAGEQNFVKAMIPSTQSYDYSLCQLQIENTEMNDLSLSLTCNVDFTAFQLEIELSSNIDQPTIFINDLRKDGHQLLYNKVSRNCYRVAALSLSNSVFRGCEGELLRICTNGQPADDICIRDIHFITTNGTVIRFGDLHYNSMATGIKNYNHNENKDIYDLQGCRHSTLQRGVNIIGGKKVVIK